MTWPWTRRSQPDRNGTAADRGQRSDRAPRDVPPPPVAPALEPRVTPSRATSSTPTDLFSFLEADLAGTGTTGTSVPADDLMARALELANNDWSEQEAARELARVADGDRSGLDRVHRQLQYALLCNPMPDIRGIRANRIAIAAMRCCSC